MILTENRVLYRIWMALAKLGTTSCKILPYNIKSFIINIIILPVLIKLYFITICEDKIYMIFYLSSSTARVFFIKYEFFLLIYLILYFFKTTFIIF